MRSNHIGIRAFWATFCLSTAILGLISLGIAGITGFFDSDDSLQQSAAGKAEYQPVTKDNLTLVLMCGEDEIQPPNRFVLFRFFPEGREIRLIPLPSELEATVNIKTGTLSELYEYGGVDMVCDAVQNAFFIQVDRYLRCDEKSLSELIDRVGGIEYRVENTVEYSNEKGETVRVVKGTQLLSGKKLYDYQNSPVFTGLSEKAQLERRTALLKTGLEQRFSEGILSQTDDIFDLMSNSMQTNLTNYDYTIRKEAIRFLARVREERVVSRMIDGEYYMKKKVKAFTPSAEGKEKVREWFEPLEGV